MFSDSFTYTLHCITLLFVFLLDAELLRLLIRWMLHAFWSFFFIYFKTLMLRENEPLCLSRGLLKNMSSFLPHFHWPSNPKCVRAMCGELMWTLIKSQPVSHGQKHTKTPLSPLGSESLLWHIVSYRAYSFILTLSQLNDNGFGLFSTEKQSVCQMFHSTIDCF